MERLRFEASMLQVLVVLSSVCARLHAVPVEPVVSTKLGDIKGIYTAVSRNFYGIPFAQPPVNDLRWKPPVAVPAWSPAEYDATSIKAGCAQVGCPYGNPPMVCPAEYSEDCLHLNIYTPLGTTPASQLAVMVFLHGGAFTTMSAVSLLYQGDNFVNKGDVILVTVNYRLGVLGFLVTEGGTDPATGNYGLQDQRMALQWIKDNIGGFGGDSGKVTMFGQSAGAQSIAIHMMSSKADALFHGAIFQSNPFSLPMKTRSDAVAQSLRVADILQCSNPDVIICLRTKTWQELATAQGQAGGFEGTLHDFQPWGPHVDGDELPMQPVVAFLTGAFTSKPLILGTVSEEGVLHIMGSEPVNVWAYYRTLRQLFGRYAFAIFLTYRPSLSSFRDLRPEMAAIVTDFAFTCPNLAIGRSISENGNTPEVWHYIFDHAFSFDGWEHITFCKGRVCHGGDLPFIFQTAEMANYIYTKDELVLSDSMIAYWSNFAKYANPRPSSSNLLSWPRYESSKRSMLFRVPNHVVTESFDQNICNFWDWVGYY